jgi:hypothetical protein
MYLQKVIGKKTVLKNLFSVGISSATDEKNSRVQILPFCMEKVKYPEKFVKSLPLDIERSENF